jgi:hypothetical protein
MIVGANGLAAGEQEESKQQKTSIALYRLRKNKRIDVFCNSPPPAKLAHRQMKQLGIFSRRETR